MKLDTKQKVLIAIYTEYQKDMPDMRENIKSSKLGLDKEVFSVALLKLENEGLINGLKSVKTINSIAAIFTDNIMMSSHGIDYIENKLGIIKTLSGSEKVEHMLKESANWGWKEAKDIISKTLSQIIKQNFM